MALRVARDKEGAARAGGLEDADLVECFRREWIAEVGRAPPLRQAMLTRAHSFARLAYAPLQPRPVVHA